MTQEIDFCAGKVYCCKCFRPFLEDVYTRHSLRGTNEILEALKKEQHILVKCEIIISKKLKKTSHNCLQEAFWQVFD